MLSTYNSTCPFILEKAGDRNVHQFACTGILYIRHIRHIPTRFISSKENIGKKKTKNLD